MMFASLSETLGSVYSVSDRDWAISWRRESSSPVAAPHMRLSISVCAVFCGSLVSASRPSACDDCPDSELSVFLAGDFRVLADSAFVGT